MHDIDQSLFEAESEGESFGEVFGEAESYEAPNLEVAQATEILEITSEAELDRFLGKLISGAVSAAKGFARSDAGKAVGGVLKSAAKQALPNLGGAVGGLVSPGGGAVGRRAGEWLGGKFEMGLETEGLSAEDREYETARAFVRFANETTQRAARSARTTAPDTAAKQAATAAAQRHLPGLLRPGGSSGSTGQRSGRWVRQGNRIVIFDA